MKRNYENYDLSGLEPSEREAALKIIYIRMKHLHTNNGRKMYHEPMKRKGILKRKSKTKSFLCIDESYLFNPGVTIETQEKIEGIARRSRKYSNNNN